MCVQGPWMHPLRAVWPLQVEAAYGGPGQVKAPIRRRYASPPPVAMHTEAFSIHWREHAAPGQPAIMALTTPLHGPSEGLVPTKPLHHLLAIGPRAQRPAARRTQQHSIAPPPRPSPRAAEGNAPPPDPAVQAGECKAAAAALQPAAAPPPPPHHRLLPPTTAFPIRLAACSGPWALHICVCLCAFALLEGAALLHRGPYAPHNQGGRIHYHVRAAEATLPPPLWDGLVHAGLPLLGMYIGAHCGMPTNHRLGRAVAWTGVAALSTSTLCILAESCVLAGAARTMYVTRRGLQACTVLLVSLYLTLHRAPEVATGASLAEAVCIMLAVVLLSCLVAVIQEATTVMMLWGVMALCMAVMAPPRPREGA